MKKFLLILLFLPCLINAQDTVSIVDIQAWPLNYPVVKYHDKNIEEKINRNILSLFFDTTVFTIDVLQDSIPFVAAEMKKPGYIPGEHSYLGGLVSFGYLKFTKTDGFLSITFYYEYAGAKIIHESRDVVFNLKTGDFLSFEEALDTNRAPLKKRIANYLKEDISLYYNPDDYDHYLEDCIDDYIDNKAYFYEQADKFAYGKIGTNFTVAQSGVGFTVKTHLLPYAAQKCDIVSIINIPWKESTQFISPKSELYPLLAKYTEK